MIDFLPSVEVKDSGEEKRPLFKNGDSFTMVNDSLLSAALISIGCGLVEAEPYLYWRSEGKEKISWHHKSQSDDGKYLTSEMMLAWKTWDEWHQQNPEHPFAYACASLKNLVYLKSGIEKCKPLAVFSKNDKKLWVQYDSEDYHRCVGKLTEL